MMPILKAFVALSTGGAIGATSRYILSKSLNKIYIGVIPAGTLSVNLIGALLIGFLWALFSRSSTSSTTQIFLMTGILGSFTTFSTYILEFTLISNNHNIYHGILYILLTNLLGITLTIVGFLLGKTILNIMV